MTRQWRIVLFAFIVVGFGLVMTIHPQDVSDIGSIARDLRKTMKDVDERLRRLELLVKDLTKAANKTGSRAPVAPPATVPSNAESEAVSKRFAAQELYQKGRIDEDSRQFARALELFTQACDLDPTNDSAFLHRAFVNYRIGRMDEALSDVNRSLAIQPDNSRAFGFRGDIYRSMKNYDRAIADLAEAMRRDGRNPEFLVSQAGIEEERGNFGKAAGLYAAALVIDPQSAQIHLKRAAALKASGDRQAAFQECGRAIELKPNEADGYACRADYYVRSGQFPEAVNDLNQAISLRPDLPQAVNLLPIVRQLIEMNQAAARLASPAAPAVPAPAVPVSAPVAPVTIAEAVPTPATPVAPPEAKGPANSGNFAELVQAARKYLDQGKFELAILKLNDALGLDPTSPVAYNARGYAYLRSRAYSSALNDFSKAIELRPSYANAHWNRSVVRRLQGDQRGAAEDAQKAVQLGWVTGNSDALKLKASR